jgi:protein-S-isoprenylcysteine O-methyltransferase Ste14
VRSERRLFAAAGSALFFIVAPGVVAGLIPWWITGWEMRSAPTLARVVGVVLISAGMAALVYSFVRFVVEGIGTPAPVAPTERLVVGGLYRYVRNPMYVAVLAIIIGQALLFGQWSLIWYALVAGGAMAAFARFYEEPNLARQFGSQYDLYRDNVPGWWPRVTPWDERRRT